jgi:malate/lactate dehydrogenase
MAFIAIVGCGALGGALAHKLAGRDRAAEVRLIDPHGAQARGKALDIQQSAAVEQFTTRLTSATVLTAAAGADVIVIADDGATGGEHGGEAGLAMLRQIGPISGKAPIVFAGASHQQLMTRAAVELRISPRRLIGTAPLALESALRAVSGVLLDVSGTELALRVVGLPPRAAVVAWEEASASALPLASQLAAHELAAMTAKIHTLWPPGPYALASAASRAVEALLGRSRHRFSCFLPIVRSAMNGAGLLLADANSPRSDLSVVAMPVELGVEGVVRVLRPALTRQEQTQLENAAGL